MPELYIEKFEGDTDPAFAAALGVRWSVFVEEQAVPVDLELDGLDAEATHYLGYFDAQPVVTARTRPYHDDTVKIERVAVLEDQRGRGFGADLMRHILGELDARGAGSVLEAQTYALGFYEKLGYQAIGDEFMDAGIPHRKMVRSAPKA